MTGSSELLVKIDASWTVNSRFESRKTHIPLGFFQDFRRTAKNKKEALVFKQGLLCEILSLASSYFDRGQPPNYRRRNSVSPPSSGRDRCGSTMP
jgi:hypothetical protein